MIGYKQFSVNKDGRLTSILDGPHAYTYKMGVWNHPKKGCGPFGVHGTLEDCVNYGRLSPDEELWRGEYEESEEDHFYSTEEPYGYNVDENTVFAAKLKLVEKIYDRENQP